MAQPITTPSQRGFEDTNPQEGIELGNDSAGDDFRMTQETLL